MKDFKHCIWFLPERNHPWYGYSDGFCPHVTIALGLREKEARDLANDIRVCDIEVKITNDVRQSCVGDFYALFCSVEPTDSENKPEWWPENAHVSFKYKYNTPFTEQEIESLRERVSVKSALLNQMRTVKCSGHFTEWGRFA